nr:serine/threonine-protein kinase Nek7-like [Lytechinus pictus]
MAALQSPFYGDKMNLYALCKKIDNCDYPPLPADHYSQEMAALHSPFYAEGLDLYSLCQKIDKCEYPALPAHYSKQLCNLVAMCIHPNPHQRPDISAILELATKMHLQSVQSS